MTRKLWLPLGLLVGALLVLRLAFSLWSSAPAEPPRVAFVPPPPAQSALTQTRPLPVSCTVPQTLHTYTPSPESLNPDPLRCTCTYGSINDETFYVWQVGKTADADKIEVVANRAAQTYTFPNNVARIAAKDVAFAGTYSCQ